MSAHESCRASDLWPEVGAEGMSIYEFMTALAVRHNAVNLGQGFPDTDGPKVLKEWAIEAIQAGNNQYSSSAGRVELRCAISRTLATHRALVFDHDEDITVTAGASEAIVAALLAFLGKDDEVIAFEPFYDYYPAFVRMAGGRFIPVPLIDAGDRWTFDPDALRRRISRKTRCLLLNTPHNPTGTVFNDEELAHLAEICADVGLLIISDEVYEWFTYGVRHRSIATFPEVRDRTFIVSGATKTFSVTGWRIGWVAACAKLTRRLRPIHQNVVFCASTPLQLAVAKALDWSDESGFFLELCETYRSKRNALLNGLVSAGFAATPPEGGHFILARRPASSTGTAAAFCVRMTSEIGVTALPLSTFYSGPERGDHLVRFAFCKRTEILEEATRRLALHRGWLLREA